MALLDGFRKPGVYRVVSDATTLLYLCLFAVLLFTPKSLLAVLGVPGSESADFLGRRAGMLMLGFAVLSFTGRNAAASTARQAIALAIGVSMAGLAVLSVREYVRGFAGPAILQAAGVEVLFAFVHLVLWASHRGQAHPNASAMEPQRP